MIFFGQKLRGFRWNGPHINFHKTFLSVFKTSKTIVFFLKTSSDYLTRSVFKDPLWKRILVYIFEYSHDVPKKKTKVLDIFIMDKKCFMKINIKSNLAEIWIRIRFQNGSGSPSLVISIFISLLWKCNCRKNKIYHHFIFILNK